MRISFYAAYKKKKLDDFDTNTVILHSFGYKNPKYLQVFWRKIVSISSERLEFPAKTRILAAGRYKMFDPRTYWGLI